MADKCFLWDLSETDGSLLCADPSPHSKLTVDDLPIVQRTIGQLLTMHLCSCHDQVIACVAGIRYTKAGDPWFFKRSLIKWAFVC